MTKYEVIETKPAWEVIGYDGPDNLRVVGGHAVYDAAIYYDDTPGDNVKLARLETGDGIRQVNRYVGPETPIEVVREVREVEWEVVTFTKEGDKIDRADCAADAVTTTARTLWDDSVHAGTGVKRAGLYADGVATKFLFMRPFG